MSEENNELPIECQSFDDEFATLIDYARMYRSLGFQVVPAMSPSSGKNWKRPALPSWKEFTNKLATEEQFNSWFSGHNNLTNIGLLTGPCSNNLFIIDLDIHKNPTAMIWWEGIHADNNGGVMLEPPTQRTGGGGLQMLFIAPDGWIPPTIKTSIGVDIRGVGGFAVVAPSKHEKKGSEYAWLPGQEPYTIPTPVATKWLCHEVSELARQFGGAALTPTGERVRTETPVHQTDQWGHLTDGREDRMYRMIFRVVVNLYRECPFIDQKTSEEAKITCFNEYVDIVETRIREPGTPKHILLEREGRGRTLFDQKWRSTIRQWDDKIAQEASRPWQSENPYKKNDGSQSSYQEESFSPQTATRITVLNYSDIMSIPDPVFMVEGLIIENSLVFIAGDPGVGKSFASMSLAMAVANKKPNWMGRTVKKHGAVIYISTEGNNDMKFRLKAWEGEYGRLKEEPPIHLIPDQLNFMSETDVNDLILAIETKMLEIGEKVECVVVDTLSKNMPGADENLQKDMSLFVKACDKIRLKFKTTVVGVHHLSRNGAGQMRGSTVLEGGADTIIIMEKVENDKTQVKVTARKIKSAEDGWVEYWGVKKVAIGFNSSLVLTPPTGAPKPEEHKEEEFGSDQLTGFTYIGKKLPDHVVKAIFDLAQSDWNDKIPWSEHKNAKSRYGVTRIYGVVKEHMPNSPFSESDALAILNHLTFKNFLVTQEYTFNKKIREGLMVMKRPNTNV